MTLPDFSVLLLAWDDADPQVAVLGGSALPPTLPLVYQLAAQHPVVALYPHLPATGTSAPPEPGLPAPAAEAAPSPPAPASATPPAEEPAPTAPRPLEPLFPAAVARPRGASLVPPPSRIVGLAELAPVRRPQPAATPAQSIITHPAAVPPVGPARSQWPTGANAPAGAREWQAPAAPYLGSGPEAAASGPQPAPPAPPAPSQRAPQLASPEPAGRPAAAASVAELPVAEPPAAPAGPPLPPPSRLAGDLRFDPDPELPALPIQQPALFDERTEEVGAAEATDIAAPEDDIVPAPPAAPAPPPEPEPVVPVPEPAAPVPHMPALDGLNFRMIQYARQAAQLVRADEAFGVIYAPNWPAWLAALEIRNSTRRPLVLYLTALARDFAGPAERGWLPELERMTLRRATLVLVPTDELRRRLRAHYGTGIGEVRLVAADDEATVQGLLQEVAGEVG